jgi:ribosomal protein L32E
MAHCSSLSEIVVANVVEVENVDRVADAAKVM